MIFVLTDDLKAANRSAVSFASTGYARRRGSLPCAVEIGFLCPQAHDDRRTAGMALRYVRRNHVGHSAAATQNHESRAESRNLRKSIHALCVPDDYRVIAPTSFRPDRSVTFIPFLPLLITNVLFSPKVAHGPCGTSVKSTNRQSVTSVSFSPR